MLVKFVHDILFKQVHVESLKGVTFQNFGACLQVGLYLHIFVALHAQHHLGIQPVITYFFENIHVYCYRALLILHIVKFQQVKQLLSDKHKRCCSIFSSVSESLMSDALPV